MHGVDSAMILTITSEDLELDSKVELPEAFESFSKNEDGKV